MKTWTDEQLDILDNEYPMADLRDLANRLGKTSAAVKAKAKKRSLKRSPDVRVWSPDKRERLIALYPDHTNLEIASILDSSESAVSGMAFKLKLRKSAKFLFEHSSKGFFPKGHQPMNKGRKQSEYMSETQIEKTKTTRFQKGHLPHNTLHDHAISERRDKTGRVYKYIRMGLSKWIPYHRYIWE